MTSIISTSPAYKTARAKLGDHRRVFDSIQEALGMVQSIYASAGFPGSFPCVAAGVGLVDVTGEDSIPPLSEWPEVYQDGNSLICVSFIGVRGLQDSDGKKANGARGFTIYPLHSIDAVRNDDSGEAWLWKIVEKEASHVAMRSLRTVADVLGADALAAAAMTMPLTVENYLEESTSESLDTSAFDELWKDFRKILAKDPATSALVPALPGKPEVLKSIRSSSYARAEYERLEATGSFLFIGETMANMIDLLRERAIENGEDFELDSKEIRAWLAGRDQKTFASPKSVELDVSKINFAGFMGASSLANDDDSTENAETAETVDDGTTENVEG